MKNHGIVDDIDMGRKRRKKSKDEKVWIRAVTGDRGEQRIFDLIQSKFSDKPCLLVNGFNEQDLLKVVKDELRQDQKRIKLSDQESKFYKATNRKFEKIMHMSAKPK